MAEDYVRPPLLGEEARSERAAVWRFRLLLLLALAGLVVGIVFLVRSFVGGSNEVNPGVTNNGLRPTSVGATAGR